MPIHVTAFPKDYQGFDPARGVRLRLEGPALRVGRAPDCDVRLPDLGVSPRHARIVRRRDGYALVDDGSAGGTWVGDVAAGGNPGRLAPHEAHPLEGLTLARFGPFRALLWPAAGGPVDGPNARRQFTLDLLARTLSGLGRYPFPVLYVREGPDGGALFDLRTLPGSPRLVGRGEGADLQVRDRYTSRRHFEVRFERGVWVRDLASRGGTWLGEWRLAPTESARWARGVRLRAGRNVFGYESQLTDALEELERGDDAPRPGSVFLPPAPVEDEPSPSAPAPAEDRAAPPEDEREGGPPVESTIRPKSPEPPGAPGEPEDD